MTSHPLLTPITINTSRISNRISVAPMSRVSTLGDGIPTQKMMDYYEQFAEGQFGLIITEGCYTDTRFSQAYPNQVGLTHEAQEAGWKRITSQIHKHDTKIILQLMHAGALSQHLSNTRAPSRIPPLRKMLEDYSQANGPYPLPHAFNQHEINAVIRGFVETAIRAERAGFDGVEIHAANGYLLDQFLTEYTNTREDQYGGSIHNRIRLTCEIIQKIKSSVSPEFIVGTRLSQGKVNDFDYKWPDGEKMAQIVFADIAHAGTDYIHFATEGKGFEHGARTENGTSLPQLARALTNLPVIANGGLHNLTLAQKIIQEGHGDLIALGTGALANPDFPNRLKSNQPISDFNNTFFANGVEL